MISNGWIVADGTLISQAEVAALQYVDGTETAPATLTLTLKSGKTFVVEDDVAIAVWGEYMRKANAGWSSGGGLIR